MLGMLKSIYPTNTNIYMFLSSKISSLDFNTNYVDMEVFSKIQYHMTLECCFKKYLILVSMFFFSLQFICIVPLF
jgi:hypothetical protein